MYFKFLLEVEKRDKMAKFLVDEPRSSLKFLAENALIQQHFVQVWLVCV